MPNIELMKKYARLLVRLGINVQKDKYLVINTEAENYEMVRYIVDEALKKGAKDVIVFYKDIHVDKSRAFHLDAEDLSAIPHWQQKAMEDYFNNGADSIILKSNYPNFLEDIPADKTNALSLLEDNLRNYVRRGVQNNGSHWCIACIPNRKWAAYVFPELDEENAYEMMWKYIFNFCKITLDKDPVEEWYKDRETFWEYKEILDKMDIDYIHFTNSKGTDIKIGMHKSSCWTCGINSLDFNEDNYLPNLPTAEIASSPDKYRVNGRVYSTKPLVFGGKLVDDFYIEFKDGKVIEFYGNTGNDVLEKIIRADEGSCYLGEVALVSKDSPIAKTDRIYYSTLLDENASCHLALGKGFPQCIKDFADKKSFEAFNLNDSSIHVDFMFGSDDMTATAYTYSGEKIIIMKDGMITL
ncbi:aminopeptidase [Natronincola ferrireducens]|uniref:Aminopeptidase n=1 Tax=Natronincola ferrireducens TaxID=393762 RepID=A0A1G9GXN1_9FIRM|nr:aminopeptidase [Natronincola ferrireducens]SDL05345.1 aminopeptidase [Natronincola ferrireducens]